MKKLCFILLFCMMSALSIRCDAQAVSLKGRISVDTILVGQPFDYQLLLTVPKDYNVDWKRFGDTLSKSIEIIREGELTTTPVENSDNVLMKQQLTLTTFDTGYVYVPEIDIYYSKSLQDSVRYKLHTMEKELYVKTVAVDTTQAFLPINGVIKQYITVKEALPWAAIVIAVIGILYLIYYLQKHRKTQQPVVVEKKKPTVPAIVTARAKLADMKDNELWNSLKVKDYYTDLTDIAREYLEGQFEIDAVEMTTDEIMKEVNALDLQDFVKMKLQDTLITADLVKFAKANPSKDENEQSFKDINLFVEDSYAYFQEEKKKKEEENK
ncbi:MAG: hypothetical protein IKX01_02935 [Bacteroidales bacterium]|nr:hypothetical protein [Bacteroidales bacterium]